jgi:pimeloyl-ACP methyl ester carboxylesterase
MKALPEAEHLVLEGVGHYPAWDAPEAICELIRKLRT